YHVFVHYDLVIDVNYLNEIDTLNLFGADYTQLLYSVFNTSATEVTAGNYRFIIPASQLIIGLNTITLQFEKLTYENATLDINLYVHLLSTNISNSVITQIDDLGETGIPIVNSTNYALYLPFDTTFELYFEDLNNSLAINDATLVSFDLNGTIIPLDSQVNGLYTWIISRDQISVGDYEVLITIGLKNYENQTFTFTFTVFEEYSIIISEIDSPTIVTQGDKFTLVLRLTYNNGHEVLPLSGETVTLSTDHDDISRISNVTNDDGYVHFEFILPTGDYNSLNMTIEYNGQKYGISGGEHGYSIEVHQNPTVPMWLIYLIMGFVGFIAIAITIQKKVIAPRRMHFTDMVMSSATIFEDAINIQHVMIIFKSWGTSIFFKSFSDDIIDPDLISGFLSAVQSFGKELKSQSALNELSYGDKILQFSDGEFIRVTLVLSKSASPYLKRNLSKFVSVFEVEFKETLEKWRGQLNVFPGTEDLIDEVLKTSVILPHKFNQDVKKPKDISRVLTKQLLGTAKSLIADDRPFLFLAQILQQAIDETGKEAPEIILSITELLDRKILIPVKIEQITTVEITEDQKADVHARVWKIPNKTTAEKEELYTQLLELSESEREMTLSSLLQTITITSEYTKEEYEVPKFAKAKDAKSEMNSLISQAKKTLKLNEFDQALKYYEFAEIIAIQWNIKDKAKIIESNILAITVKKYRYNLKTARKMARKFEKAKEYELAGVEYQRALDAAHMVFQLGFEDVEENIKILTHKVIENKQESSEKLSNEDCVTSEDLTRSRKALINSYSKKNKSKTFDVAERIEHLTKIAVISNLLFKFGSSSEIKNVKTYQKKIDNLKQSLQKESEEYQAQYAAKAATLQEMTNMLEKMRKEVELDQNWFDVVILYQKRLNIEYQLGNIDRGVYLAGQIRAKLSKIPYIYDLIDECKQKIKFAEEQSNASEIQQNQDLLEILFQIMFKFD
ncbi:MAG: Ig-like domain-containing protein, partial [Promethearchaeota archaeon]